MHDRAANMVRALEIPNDMYGWQSLLCSAHSLQLCLNPGLAINPIDRLIKAARKYFGHFKHSVLATKELKKRQSQMEVEQKKLFQDFVTRWNSTFYMVECLVEVRWPISAVLLEDRVTKRSDRYLDLKSDQ